MSANAKQVGGAHYRAELQHWDLIERYGIGYLEGCATKYLTRFEKKNGVQDLEKALHYAEKLLELHRDFQAVHEGDGATFARQPRGVVPIEAVHKFVVVNDVNNSAAETAIIYLLRWQTETDLIVAIEAIKRATTRFLEQLAKIPSEKIRTGQLSPFGYDEADA